MRKNSEKTDLLSRLGQWAFKHPVQAFLVNLFISISFFVAIAYLFGCSKPLIREQDYGKSVIGPRSYGSVEEPDMAY